jgi:hypothetical protein
MKWACVMLTGMSLALPTPFCRRLRRRGKSVQFDLKRDGFNNPSPSKLHFCQQGAR